MSTFPEPQFPHLQDGYVLSARGLRPHNISVTCLLLWPCRPQETHATGSGWASASSSNPLHQLCSLRGDSSEEAADSLPRSDTDLSGSRTPDHRLRGCGEAASVAPGFYGIWKIISWSTGQDVPALGPPSASAPPPPSFPGPALPVSCTFSNEPGGRGSVLLS